MDENKEYARLIFRLSAAVEKLDTKDVELLLTIAVRLVPPKQSKRH